MKSNTVLFYALFLFCLLYLTGCSSTKETIDSHTTTITTTIDPSPVVIDSIRAVEEQQKPISQKPTVTIVSPIETFAQDKISTIVDIPGVMLKPKTITKRYKAYYKSDTLSFTTNIILTVPEGTVIESIDLIATNINYKPLPATITTKDSSYKQTTDTKPWYAPLIEIKWIIVSVIGLVVAVGLFLGLKKLGLIK